MVKYEHRLISLSKRGYIYFLEHCRVHLQNAVVAYTQSENGTFKSYNIPSINTSILMLGEGTSITRDAVMKLTDSGTLLMFVGGRGTPLHATSDLSFNVISPASEYRPTEYMQAWSNIFFNKEKRLSAAKLFMKFRIENIKYFYKKLDFIKEMNINELDYISLLEEFSTTINKLDNTNLLLSAEALFTKKLYKLFSRKINFNNFTREHAKNSKETDFDIANSFLDHGNYLFYGLGAITLHGLGISYAFALLHGKTRRGALVFDVADLIKDSLCLPYSFYATNEGYNDKDFRSGLIELIHKEKILDRLFEQVKSTAIGDYNA